VEESREDREVQGERVKMQEKNDRRCDTSQGPIGTDDTTSVDMTNGSLGR
jgi:hypothetical protein